MTVHLSMSYKCEACEFPYIPYNETIVCPKCGEKGEVTEEYASLIKGICESFIYNLYNYKSYIPDAWWCGDLSDNIQHTLFPVYEHCLKNHKDVLAEYKPEEFREISDWYIKEKVNLADILLPAKDYMKQLSFDVYEKAFEQGVNLSLKKKACENGGRRAENNK